MLNNYLRLINIKLKNSKPYDWNLIRIVIISSFSHINTWKLLPYYKKAINKTFIDQCTWNVKWKDECQEKLASSLIYEFHTFFWRINTWVFYFICFHLSFREKTSIFIIVPGKSEPAEKVTQISNRLWKVKAWNQWWWSCFSRYTYVNLFSLCKRTEQAT